MMTETTNEPSSEDFGLVLKIVQDDDPPHPRRDWEGMGTMALFHKRYELGDKNHGLSASDFDGWDAMEEHLYRKCDAAVVLPVYLYDHSGISIQTEPFSCRWDSGQIGFIYISREQVRNLYSRKRITKALLAQVTAALESEVRTYDQYLTGDVWGYVIETKTGEHVDSCFGIYGEDDARAEGEMALAQEKSQRAYDLAKLDELDA